MLRDFPIGGGVNGRTKGEGYGRKTRGQVTEESHIGIRRAVMVPVNRPNKDGQPSAEGEEGRPMIKENVNQQHTPLTQGGTGVSQRLEGVRTAARENKELRFTALLHHMTVERLRGISSP